MLMCEPYLDHDATRATIPIRPADRNHLADSREKQPSVERSVTIGGAKDTGTDFDEVGELFRGKADTQRIAPLPMANATARAVARGSWATSLTVTLLTTPPPLTPARARRIRSVSV